MEKRNHPNIDAYLTRRALYVLSLLSVCAIPFAVAQRSAIKQGAAVSSPPSIAQKIAPWVMEHTANGQQAEFFVVLADQADLKRADNLQKKPDKGRYVYNTPYWTRARSHKRQFCDR
jgi:hypothetical protein